MTKEIGRRIPFNLASVRDIKYHSSYNLQKTEAYSFRDFESSRSTIYGNYISRYEADFKERVGADMSPEDYLEKAGIQASIYKEMSGFLEEMDQVKTEYQVDQNKLNLYLADMFSSASDKDKKLDKLRGKEKEILSALERWKTSTENYLDVLGSISNLYQFENQGDSKVSGAIAAASGRNISEAFSLEKSAATSLLRADALTKDMTKVIDDFRKSGASVEEMKDFVIKEPSTYSIGGEVQSSTYNSLLSAKKLIGTLNQIGGFVFEVALVNGLQKQVGDAVETVALLGGAEGVNITLDGKPFKVATSKRDVSYKTKDGVELGLSVKMGEYKKTSMKKIGLNTSSMDKILSLVTNNQADKSQLAGTVMWRANESKRAGDSLNLFMAALTADYAIAMGGNDRVDLMVFNNQVVPLSAMYRMLEKKLRLNLSPREKEETYRKNLRDSKMSDIISAASGIGTTYYT